jgi:hypothetical protein
MLKLLSVDVLGLVQCGKSAAIYACAKEQGFLVIEVSEQFFFSLSSCWEHAPCD